MMDLNVAGNLKRLRKERKLTQEELADSIGVSFQSISKWECGNGYPDIIMLPVLSKFFNITVDELIGMNDIKNQDGAADKDDCLAMSIEIFGGMVRTINCLKRAGIITVRDIVNKTENDVLKIRNLSAKSFDEVVQKLNSLGLLFRKEV